jgi:hypothetical protein
VFGPPKNDGSYVKENKGDLHGVGAGRCRPVNGPTLYGAFLKLLDELRITLHWGGWGLWVIRIPCEQGEGTLVCKRRCA